MYHTAAIHLPVKKDFTSEILDKNKIKRYN